MGTKKKMVLFGPPYLHRMSLKTKQKFFFFHILWNVFYNMCEIQNHLIKSTVGKKLMKKGHYLWASPLNLPIDEMRMHNRCEKRSFLLNNQFCLIKISTIFSN